MNEVVEDISSSLLKISLPEGLSNHFFREGDSKRSNKLYTVITVGTDSRALNEFIHRNISKEQWKLNQIKMTKKKGVNYKDYKKPTSKCTGNKELLELRKILE